MSASLAKTLDPPLVGICVLLRSRTSSCDVDDDDDNNNDGRV